MITAIQVTGIAYEVDESTHKYVMKRIGHLDRYLPRHARKTVSAEVKLAEVNHDHGNKFEVEVIFNLPGKVVTAKDSTGNMLAAVNIVEAKIQAQLRDYKQAAIAHIGNRGVMSRFKRSFKREL
ncbi:MAG TPA: ribosome-associated translation inhibitor RaiA [Candidatus Saccharimonadales bacterium]|nr:ribosome-associated translation inhibitor RaiA [Candidatus Saccharimonadales bacterium]